MEDLAYRRCLDLYYTREHALPADVAQVARLIGMRDHQAEVEAVLKEFFVPEEHGDWVHSRCEAEIKKAQEAAERARNNGKAGGRPAGSHKQPSSNPQITQPVSSGAPEESKSKAPITQDQDQSQDQKEERGSPKARASRKCPEAFVLTPELIAWAASEAPGVPLETETAKLRDHTFKNAISDWPGAWRNWMRRAQENARKPQGLTFRERDSEARAKRIEEMTGGLLKRPSPDDFIDMEDSHAVRAIR
jgi:uncharacterized protein YdaU (DUF1376 family)